MMKIYEKIRKARQLKQIPLVEMAEKMGMSEDGYSLLERGKRRFDDDKIERAAVVLDMDLADLMGINESSTICGVVGGKSLKPYCLLRRHGGIGGGKREAETDCGAPNGAAGTAGTGIVGTAGACPPDEGRRR